MKIQPADSFSAAGNDQVKHPAKSRFKRLFERQFSNALRSSSTDKLVVVGGEQSLSRDSGSDTEPSSVCLWKLVDNYIEDSNEKLNQKCGRSRCNCFNGNCTDSSDEETEVSAGSSEFILAAEILKNLVTCPSATERNILADTARIIDRNKISKRKDDCRKIVVDGLLAQGYDASICKSRWEKCASFPAGEYEYIDVILEGERILIDVDFKSEFKIARSTKKYRAVLQSLPPVFVGKPDRLRQIVAIVSEAAKHSLKKKGLHVPPWRKPEYVRAKWLSSYERTTNNRPAVVNTEICPIKTEIFSGEFEMRFGEKSELGEKLEVGDSATRSLPKRTDGADDRIKIVVSQWQPPEIKPKGASQKGAGAGAGAGAVTGLASILLEQP